MSVKPPALKEGRATEPAGRRRSWLRREVATFLAHDEGRQVLYLFRMMKNRSVPTNAVLPHIVYENVAEAIEWLTRVFGFREHFRYGDPTQPQGAQISFGDAWFMLDAERPGRQAPKNLGSRSQYLTVFIENVDEQFERVKAAGAKIVEELNEPIYGERQFAVEDLGGHVWLFSKHVRDMDPAEWGAIVKG